jgi:hypothetical protein
MVRLPDFIIIGAMKCATTTLHEQLAAQEGVFLTEPKEPCFFSDDPVYEKGMEWYQGLFAEADPKDVCGESSTHYAKLPTYPKTLERMRAHLPGARLIYMMRSPVERLVSQHRHEWMVKNTGPDVNAELDRFPALIDYGRYAYQLEPFLRSYGPQRILPVFSERLRAAPQEELERVARFIGLEGPVTWQTGADSRNRSSEHLRVSPVRDALLNAPVLRGVRRGLVPKPVRNRIKRLWQLREPPPLREEKRARLEALYDEDLARLGRWLGVNLTCANFVEVASARPHEWTEAAPRPEGAPSP